MEGGPIGIYIYIYIYIYSQVLRFIICHLVRHLHAAPQPNIYIYIWLGCCMQMPHQMTNDKSKNLTVYIYIYIYVYPYRPSFHQNPPSISCASHTTILSQLEKKCCSLPLLTLHSTIITQGVINRPAAPPPGLFGWQAPKLPTPLHPCDRLTLGIYALRFRA